MPDAESDAGRPDLLERLSAVAEANRCMALSRLATREALVLMRDTSPADADRPKDCGCGHETCPGVWSGECPCSVTSPEVGQP